MEPTPRFSHEVSPSLSCRRFSIYVPLTPVVRIATNGYLMHGHHVRKTSSLRKRLDTLEQEQADRARRERVPVTQSYQLYHALKDNGVPVKFVAYPVPGHFPYDPVRSRDVFSRWLGWLDQYLK